MKIAFIMHQKYVIVIIIFTIDYSWEKFLDAVRVRNVLEFCYFLVKVFLILNKKH